MSLASQVNALATRVGQEVKGKLGKVSWNGLSDLDAFKVARGVVHYARTASTAGDPYLVIQTNIPAAGGHMITVEVEGVSHSGTPGPTVAARLAFTSDGAGTYSNLGGISFGDNPVTAQVATKTSGGMIAIILQNSAAQWLRHRIKVDASVGNGLVADSVFTGWTVAQAASLSAFSNVTAIPLPGPRAAAVHTHVAADVTDVTVVPQAEAEAGTATTLRFWTAQRVKQAIVAIAPTLGLGPITGEIKAWPGPTAPTGWFLLDGSVTPSRTTYAALYSALGGGASPYGQGNGLTTFDLPNYADKFPIGASGTKDLGDTGGDETKVIVGANLPPHTHTLTSRTGAAAFGSASSVAVPSATGTLSQNTTQSQSPTGTSTPLDIMPPWLATNYIIKY